VTGCGGPAEPAQSPDDVKQGSGDPMLPKGWSGAPSGEDAQKGKLDEQQVQIVLARAAKNAHQCVDIAAAKDQPHGDGTVTVTFAGKGRSTKAAIDAPFDGTQIGACATRAFVDIIIPPFDGPDIDKKFQVDLKPTSKKK